MRKPTSITPSQSKHAMNADYQKQRGLPFNLTLIRYPIEQILFGDAYLSCTFCLSCL